MTDSRFLLDAVLATSGVKQQRGDQWMIRCPAHDDRRPSLSVRLEGDRLLLHCFAGCSYDDVRTVLAGKGVELPRQAPHAQAPSLSGTALAAGPVELPRQAPHAQAPLPGGERGEQIQQTYDYCDESGRLVFQVVRGPDKKFRQRRRVKEGWDWKLGHARRVPYRLPELSADPSADVIVLEGEKDVDLAASMGLLATCNPGGAGKWKHDYSELIGRRRVYVVPDNDAPGRQHARAVVNSIREAGGKARIVELPDLPPKGDFSDWVREGGTREVFLDMCRAAPEQELVTPLAIRSLSTIAPQEVRWLWPARVPRGKVTLIAGDPNLGKSFLTLDMAARVSTGKPWPDLSDDHEPSAVLLLNAEDDPADTLVPRLKSAGADLSKVDVIDGVKLPGEDESRLLRLLSLERDIDGVSGLLSASPGRYALVVIDPISAYLDGLDANSNTDVRQLLTRLGQLASKHGVAVVVISHLRKSSRGKAVYRTIGSLAFTAAARAVWTVIKDPDDEGRRLLLPVKMNMAADPGGLAYRIAEGRCLWEDQPVTCDADFAEQQGTNEASYEDRVRIGEELLLSLLGEGPMPVGDIRQQAQERGVSRRALWEAKANLGVQAISGGQGNPWHWRLPEAEETKQEAA